MDALDPALRLHPGQQNLTPEQKAEARRFAAERIRTQLSTEPVDEQKAETLLRQAYQAAHLAAPQRVQWLDSPLQLVWTFLPKIVEASEGRRVWDNARNRVSIEASGRQSLWDSIENRVKDTVNARVGGSVRTSANALVGQSVRRGTRQTVENMVARTVHASTRSMWALVKGNASQSAWESLRASSQSISKESVRVSIDTSVHQCAEYSVCAYHEADWLAFFHFIAVFLAPNETHGLAHFNELVSGYWLGKEVAYLVRRPRALSLDGQSRLHSATGKCVEYYDGWGFYAWHGVQVPNKVILAPEKLTGKDFLSARNLETCRLVQERMGQRFVSELGGIVIDSSTRGTLYEVRLSGDPERVARYAQVQDASTERQYFLRVPPTIQTAAEAVAWSFGLSVEAYHPAQET